MNLPVLSWQKTSKNALVIRACPAKRSWVAGMEQSRVRLCAGHRTPFLNWASWGAPQELSLDLALRTLLGGWPTPTWAPGGVNKPVESWSPRHLLDTTWKLDTADRQLWLHSTNWLLCRDNIEKHQEDDIQCQWSFDDPILYDPIWPW